jgi:hypothetical protein
MWKQHPDYEQYDISSDGNVRRHAYRDARGHRHGPHTYTPILSGVKQTKTGYDNRYRTVGIWIDGRRVWKKVGVLVLETFVGPRPEGCVLCHGPKGQFDDSLDNVTWGSWEKNNGTDRHRDGTIPNRQGEKNPRAKLTAGAVRDIRRSLSDGILGSVLAQEYGVTPTMISKIRRRECWKHLKEDNCVGIT